MLFNIVSRDTVSKTGIIVLLLLASATVIGAETDLSAGWIERLPKIEYVWNSSKPDIEGWPEAGQQVKWVAHVRNLSESRLNSVSYSWLLNGKKVASGQASLEPHRVTTFEFPWTWKRERHKLIFEIDSDRSIQEIEERNNRLMVYTDSIAVGFWVEQTFWDSIQDVIKRANIGCTTFEDWMQLRVRQFNEMAGLARYKETPKGVLDRWRIDKIEIVPDGALPLSPLNKRVRKWGAPRSSYPTLYPDVNDYTIDMQWGFPASSVPFYADADAWRLLYDSLIHELGHARYLVDLYAWDVTTQGDSIRIEQYPSADQNGRFHEGTEHGLMNTSWGFIDRYSAIAMNRIAGHRAILGHYNEPSNIGSFVNDLPAMNRIRIETPDGKIFPNRKVRIYRASAKSDRQWRLHIYQLKFDAKPDLEFMTDDHGVVSVGRNPFAARDISYAVNRFNALAIVEVVDGKTSHWGYLEVLPFNLAYWRGETEVANHVLVVDAPVCLSGGLGPNVVQPDHEALVTGPQVNFQWPALGNSTSTAKTYELWYSVDGKRPKRKVVTGTAAANSFSATVGLRGKRVAWWLVYQRPSAPASCPKVRTSTYFFDLK